MKHTQPSAGLLNQPDKHKLASNLDDVSNGIGDPGRSEVFHIDTNDSDVSLRGFVAALIIDHFEIITYGLVAFEPKNGS